MAGPVTLRLPDDEGGAAPSLDPGTLKAPPTVDKDYVRQKELEYKRLVREAKDANPDAEYKPEGGIVYKLTTRAAGGGALSEFGFATDSEGNIDRALAEPEIRKAYSDWIDAQDELKYLSASQGSAKSWYDTEEDKSREIERQYDDFKDRSTTYSRLLSDEQDYAMNVDEANANAYKYMRQTGAASYGAYHDLPMSESLSSILRPSLPDYVRPDYRLNAAVGLPGPEGFDDPDYDANGMPRFAAGTDGQQGYRDLLTIVKEQLGRVPQLLQPAAPWPWRREA